MIRWLRWIVIIYKSSGGVQKMHDNGEYETYMEFGCYLQTVLIKVNGDITQFEQKIKINI